MKLTKRALDTLDIAIETVYRRNHAGVQISMLDIGKIFRAARSAAQPHILAARNIDTALQAAAGDIETAVNTTVAAIRLN